MTRKRCCFNKPILSSRTDETILTFLPFQQKDAFITQIPTLLALPAVVSVPVES